jgi:hypothetical protein
MRFALLGADPESLALADAAEAAGHAIVWREEPEPSADSTAWEALLDDELCDAVIIGTSATPDLRARQIQELTKQGRPLLTVHPVVPSVITYFEIDMARTESRALLQHFNPLVESIAVARAAEWVSDGHPEFGAVEQIAATRTLSDRSRDAVTWHFARDVELLARLAGRLNRIGAHGGGDADTAFASLSVQLSGPRTVPARWAVEPASQSEPRVAFVCQQGRATLVFESSGRCVQLVEQGASGSHPRTTTFNETPAATSIARFVSEAERQAADASTWPAALDAMELADSIEISLRRGRMIDVHHRELTEQLAFKGVMSAVGCGVLVVVVPLMLVAGWIAGLVGIPLSAYWPHVLLAFLAAFLALQVLPKLLAKPAPAPASENDETADESNLPHDSAD